MKIDRINIVFENIIDDINYINRISYIVKKE